MSNPNTSSRPLRAIVFASEQLVPALQFLLHTADRFGRRLQAIHVFHTDDERRSAGPARRLQTLLQRSARKLAAQGTRFEVVLGQGAATPAGVRDVLLPWFSTAPEAEWLVNVTGGTKPMSAAAVELTHSIDLPARRVVYQELGSGWSEIAHDDDGLLTMLPLRAGEDALVPAAGTLERLLSLPDLVATQFSADHEITAEALPRTLPVDLATQHLLANGWRWQDALAVLPTPVSASSNGIGFELFLGAGLRDCGLTRLGQSLKVSDPGRQGKVVREIDLVACHRDRLICIDIKLPGAHDDQKGTQLADVAELARSLGGHGALAVAVRPGWPDDEGTRKLAKALGVKLLTQADAAQPFSTLLGWINDKDKEAPTLQPSAAVRAAEAQLLAHQRRGNAVLSDGRHVTPFQVDDSGMVHLPTAIEQIVQRRGEPWALVQLDAQRYWLAIPKKLVPITQAPDWPARGDRLWHLMRDSSDTRAVFDFRDTDAWVTVQFSLRPGIKRDTLLERLRSVLCSPSAA